MEDYKTQDLIGSVDESLDEEVKLVEASRIKTDTPFEEPQYTLSYGGIGFAPKGNIMAVMAEMKHGKTFVNTIFAVALTRGEYLGIKGLVDNAKVLFFDTEQDLADGLRILRRVQYLNGWDFAHDEETRKRFSVYHLREKSIEQRIDLIETAIKLYRPDVVFIDGIRDLLADFNSLEESSNIIQWLMELSSNYNVAIWTVLHVNPKGDKMRGHLGTELGNKVTDVFQVRKEKNGFTNEVSFKVQHVAARHRDVNDFDFVIDNDLPFGIPVSSKQEEGEEQVDLQSLLIDVMNIVKSGTKSSITNELRKKGLSKAQSLDLIESSIRSGVLVKADGWNFRLDEKQTKLPF